MERRRYLVRKSDSFTYPEVRTSGDAICLCNCSNAPYNSYDLQTQTVIFGEEIKPKKDKKGVFSCTSLLKKFSDDSTKASNSCSKMDQDLEFYPVDDHPSPSTFTAWDAFLTGNQAFFREPPCLLPDPAFSYMDVIPEEDDMESLLESDTDDTGSSVSTVIDRFSRASTANSSFSERCSKSSTEMTFDLEQVLSPFEKLEKELDAGEPKDSEELQSKKDTQRGPIVVITNSNSCEDVRRAEEDKTSNEAEVKKDLNSVTGDLDTSNVNNLKNGVISDCQEKNIAAKMECTPKLLVMK
ncbi:uncharacterized protein LOC118188769 [Stegodyphus dumicola]|uniref:uncharacterized protein LOC118188769 n=1 Tax=Stegodyphus dumicola TaxID=202533 RepID=UPI0015B354C2|nr:uncharacterized protein LOC118188769 [Stegodyphus dumicola]